MATKKSSKKTVESTEAQVFPKGYMGTITRQQNRPVLSLRQEVCPECENGYIVVPVGKVPEGTDTSTLGLCSKCGWQDETYATPSEQDASTDSDQDPPSVEI